MPYPAIFFSHSNRAEFVSLFVGHALYGSCSRQVDAYLRGLRMLLAGPLLKLCRHDEVFGGSQ